MIPILLTACAAFATSAAFPGSSDPAAPRTAAASSELEERLAAAGKDPAKLLEVARWCETEERDEDARKVYEMVLAVDADNEDAHRGLRHHFYDGRWFTSFVALSKHRRAEEARMLEKGLVRFREDWAPKEDVPFLRMGWVKVDGDWTSPRRRQEQAREEELQKAGFQQQDLVWVDPTEFDKWRAGLWKCGEEWLANEEAEAWHARLDRPWRFPAKRFIVEATCDRKSVEWAGWWADQAYDDCLRAYGVEPEGKPTFVVVRGVDQYNTLAVGDPDLGVPPTEADGTSSCHYAYYAEAWFDGSGQTPDYRGCGVCYWDSDDATLAAYGQHAVRHAAAQSYAEAIDPSWETVSRWVEAPGGGLFPVQAFWAEKRIPRWFRYGVASYAERYFRDPNVVEDGNPWWAREWALENLRRNERIRPMEEIFAFPLDVNQPEDGGPLIGEAGLLVSFILDGGCKPVTKAHEEVKAALSSGEDATEAFLALQKALEKNEQRLLRYAGM